MPKIIAEKLRKLADEIEQGDSNVIEVTLQDHFKSCLIIEKGLYQHTPTGDTMVSIRVRNKELKCTI